MSSFDSGDCVLVAFSELFRVRSDQIITLGVTAEGRLGGPDGTFFSSSRGAETDGRGDAYIIYVY